MADPLSPKIYVRLFKRVKLPRSVSITLGKVARIHTDDRERLQRIFDLELVPLSELDGQPRMIDLLHVIEKIKQIEPEADIEYIGEPQTIVEFSRPQTGAHFLYLALIWLLLFTGSGLAIMNFHADVSMATVHQKLYAIITGREVVHPLLLQIPYSLGLGSGMILFFNRFFKRRLNEEPDPLELEMYRYDDSIHDYRVAQNMKAQTGTRSDAADGDD